MMLNSKIKKVVLFFSFFPVYAFAYVPLVSDAPLKSAANSQNLQEFLKIVYNWGVLIAVGLAVLFIIFGGIQYMTTDSVFKKDEGRKRVVAAVAGLLIVLSSWLILNQINPKIFENSLNLGTLDKSKLNTSPITAGGVVVGGGNPAFVPGATQSEQEILTYLQGLGSGNRSEDGSFFFTTYGGPNDSTPDSNTQKGLGNRNNLLSPGSVALSPDLISRYRPEPGASVYINNNFVGYYDDTTASQYQGTPIRNTVDIYNPSGSMGQQLKKIDSGGWNITFGQARP